MPDQEFVSHSLNLAKLVDQGFLYRSDAIAELTREWAITGAAAEDVLDRMVERNREQNEQSEWDVANNVHDSEDVGEVEFHVEHFKGIQGWRDHEGQWHKTGKEPKEYWSVSLPHQCDDWDVLYCEDHAEAVRKLQMFITDAKKALEKLQAML